MSTRHIFCWRSYFTIRTALPIRPIIIVITKVPNITVDHGSSHGIRNTGAIPPTKPIARDATHQCAAFIFFFSSASMAALLSTFGIVRTSPPLLYHRPRRLSIESQSPLRGAKMRDRIDGKKPFASRRKEGGTPLKLERFAYFLAVAQTGSITLGAQKSFITQTAMSQQMAALEAELGLPLLKRSKSGTSLTEAGQALVPMAERLVQCYQAIETFADAQRHQPRTLTIAYTGPMEQQLLLRAIPAFRAHHPEVELRVRQLSMARIGTALEAGDCDIALAIPGEIPLQQMKHVTVMERPICAAVASSHPLAGKNSVTLPELTHFPVILLQAGANRRASSQIARWLMGLGWTKDALRFADTIEDQLLMINLNQGISFMPQGSYPVGIRLIPIVSDTPILHHTEAVMRQMTPLHLQFVEQLRQADMAERHP